MAFSRRGWGIIWAGVLMLGLLAAPSAAYGADDCEGGGPGPSTPGLRVHISNPSSAEWKITAVASVDESGNPTANLVLWDAQTRVTDFEAHRVALRGGHDDHSTLEDGEHDALKATIRGAGVNELGERVQVWIDVVDNGNRANTDEIRVRVRALPDHGEEHETDDHEEGEHDDGGCGGGGSGGPWTEWMTVRQVQVFAPVD